MSWSYDNTIKTARANATTASVGVGAKLSIWTAGYGTKLAEWTWAGNVWAAATNGATVMNAPNLASVLGLAAGTVVIGKLTRANTTIAMSDLTVGTSNANIIVSSNVVSVNQICTLLAFSSIEAA